MTGFELREIKREARSSTTEILRIRHFPNAEKLAFELPDGYQHFQFAHAWYDSDSDRITATQAEGAAMVDAAKQISLAVRDDRLDYFEIFTDFKSDGSPEPSTITKFVNE